MAKTTKSETTETEPFAEAPAKRRLKIGNYSSFKLQKSMKAQAGGSKLPGSFRLLWGSMALLWRHKKLFGGIIVVAAILNFVVVQGFSNIHDITNVKSQLSSAFGNGGNRVASGLVLFVYLLGSSNTSTADTSGNSSAYGVIWILLISLALIWTLRQVYASKKVRIRDGFYSGMYPLIPFILVLLVMILELLPGVIGAEIYSVVASNGIAITGVEQAIWAVLMGALILLSFYMLCSSLFAAYVVCLPDMAPIKALRSARQLVMRRRWTVMRKVLFLPFALFILGAIIMLPFITFATAVAGWLFFILCVIGLAITHSYYYALYRSLL